MAYSKEVADRVLTLLVEGKSLRVSCKECGITASSFHDWMDADQSLADDYARARLVQYKALADEIMEIADEAEVTTVVQGEEVKLAMDGVAVQRNKLRVDTRKWMLSKMLPKIYGDKVDSEVTVTHKGDINMIARAMSDEELNRSISEKLKFLGLVEPPEEKVADDADQLLDPKEVNRSAGSIE